MSSKHSTIKQETKFEYEDKLDGQSVKFKPVKDEFVATFDKSSPSRGMTALRSLNDTAVYLSAPESGYAVLRSDDANAAIDSLARDHISNALPVMIDGDGLHRYFLPDEFTVQFAEGVTQKKAKSILAEFGVLIRQQQRTPGYYTVAVPGGKGLFKSIRAIAKRKEVLFAEPSEFGIDDELEEKADLDIEDDIFLDEFSEITDDSEQREDEAEEEDALALPSDSFFGRLWGLHNIGQIVDNQTGSIDADIDAPQAWNIETGKRNVVVAVIDTGCDLDHPDLRANILPRGSEDWDFADASDKVPWDSGTHGSHVAGTVAARRNRKGVVGVAYRARLMPLRVNLTSGKNQNRADAINYVKSQAIKYRKTRRYVINCSWRMSGNHAGVRNAIKAAVRNNVVVIFAAGNANNNIDRIPQYPAVYPEVIAVAATDQRDRRASFSNYGKKVDIAAPGVNIYSTIPNNTYGFKDGTSMAAPHVAGVAALIWSKNPDMTNAQVRKCIEATTDNIDAKNPGFVGKLGSGRLNAFKALLHVPPRKLRVKIVAKFKFPQKNAGSSTGLTYVERFPLGSLGARRGLLFLTQKAGSERIFLLHPTTGAKISSLDPAGNDTIGSLAWDGSAIRAANVTTGAGSINRINPLTGTQMGSIPAPPGRGEGLVSVGSRIYYSTISTIHELRTSTGAVLRSFPAPEGQSRSLTYGRGLLFSGDSSDGKITVFNRSSLSIRGVINAPGGGNRQAEGLAFDSQRRILYVANQSENVIYALRVSGI